MFCGLLKLFLFGALSTTVYSWIGLINIPPGVSFVLRSGFDFLISFGDFILKHLFYIITCFSGYCYIAIKAILPVIIKCLNIAFSFSGWIAIRTFKGIMGFTDPMTAGLSWIMLVGLIYLFMDRKLRNYNTPTVVMAIEDNVTNITNRHDSSDTSLFDDRNPVNNDVNDDRHVHQLENLREDHLICHQNNCIEVINDDTPQMCSDHVNPGDLSKNDSDEHELNAVQNIDSGEDSKIIMTEVLRRRLRSYNDMNLCIICYQKERNVAIFPCGHTSLCSECVHVLRTMTNKCPICKTVIEEERTIYI